MPNGFQGKVLRVNLSTRNTEEMSLDEIWYRTYIGGWGLIAYILLREVPADCDPLGPENKLIIAEGLLTGWPLAGSGRNAFGAKSPLTGAFGAAEAGGFFGAELRRAGWDGIIVEGRAESPVYLWIHDDRVEIRDAAHLWGRPTGDVERAIKAELDEPQARIAQIGPAGERKARLACIINDVSHAAGRTGLGAVMGAKNLRAIAVRGTRPIAVHDPDTLRRWSRWHAEQVREDPVFIRRKHYGSNGFMLDLQAFGGLPTRHFLEGAFDGAEQIDGQAMARTILTGDHTCFACPVRCKRRVELHDTWDIDPIYGGPEYETAAAFGSLCLIDDLPAIAKANELCNAYGLDTIGTGVTIAWAMECFERGLLTRADTDGIELRFGNAPAMVKMVEKIIAREGLGDILAQGAYRAAHIIGRGTEQYVMHVKHQEIPMHDPRIKFALDIGYAVSPTGADHVHNIHDVMFDSANGAAFLHPFGIYSPLPAKDLSPAKMRMAKRVIHYRIFLNCLGLCNFMGYSIPALREIIQAGTGWDYSLFELQECGERVMDMARVFNYRCGVRPEDDRPPARFSEPVQNGPNRGTFLPAGDVERALALYYDMMGWDHQTGAPMPWKLHELGLSWLPEVDNAEG